MNVLITGTDSGLGEALYHRFNAVQARVLGTGLMPKTLYWDANNMLTNGNVLRAVRELGPLDIVIHNAGVNSIRKFEELTPSFILEAMTVNFLAPVMLTQELLLSNLFRAEARVCHVISDAAWRPMRHSLAYNCSKAAMDMAVKQMARELTKPYGLTVFGVRPGKMSGTRMTAYIDEQVCRMRGWTPEEAQHYWEQNSVTGEMLHPKDVADYIYYLCTSALPLSGTCIDMVG